MHIIVIGWLFVAIMLSIGERSLAGAIFTFLLWGVLPISLIIYIFGRRARRAQAHQDTGDEERSITPD